MTQPPPWSARLVRLIAGEVKRWRDRREMSAQQLADACEALGHPIPRSVIANLESGRRETISVPEVVVLAKALEVSPVQLLYPLGVDPEVEALPGRTVDTEAAMRWFTGQDDPFRDEARTRVGLGRQHEETGLHEWYETGYEDASAPVTMYAQHRALLAEYTDAYFEAYRRLGDGTPDERFRSELATIRKRGEDAIKAKRAEMRRRGIAVLPALPPELAHLEQQS